MSEPVTTLRSPLPVAVAWRAVARCFATSLAMLGRREVHSPRENVGRVIRFADGSIGRVYRETVVNRSPADPCVLVVSFRLKGVHGRGHALFRAESILNTPLFVGFPGFVSKLWLSNDDRGLYRGVYQWDGVPPAERYARSLWRVLALVSERGSIDYHILPGLGRNEVLTHPELVEPEPDEMEHAWWRMTRDPHPTRSTW